MTAPAPDDPHPLTRHRATPRGGAADPPRGGAARRALAWLGLPLVLGLAACTAEARTAGDAPVASPFADCSALTQPPPSAPAAFATMDKNSLPDLELPCFTGGAAVKLDQVRAPAVINLWASWCEPCRSELPAMQELADRAEGRLTVIGVNTFDQRDSAASFAADSKVSLPTLVDSDKRLLSKLGRTTLPVTIFLGDHGSWHIEPSPLDDTRLDQVVQTWTGVTVSR